jgi:diketogulonate reductase-like aldo/keto reductase
MPVHSLEPESIRREVEDSLRRLRVNTIDLYQIHWPAFPPDNADPKIIVVGWQCLVDLKQSGKVRHIGVSNFDLISKILQLGGGNAQGVVRRRSQR